MTTPNRLGATLEAAILLGVDRSTLSRWVTAGKIRPVQRTAGGHMLFDLDELEDHPLRRAREQRVAS